MHTEIIFFKTIKLSTRHLKGFFVYCQTLLSSEKITECTHLSKITTAIFFKTITQLNNESQIQTYMTEYSNMIEQ